MPKGIYKRTKNPLKYHKLDCRCDFCIVKRGEGKGKKSRSWTGGKRSYWQNLSKKVWEEHHGRKIPKGGIIHHKDENWKNIDPTNLEMIIAESGKLNDSRGKHISWHATLKQLHKRAERFLKALQK